MNLNLVSTQIIPIIINNVPDQHHTKSIILLDSMINMKIKTFVMISKYFPSEGQVLGISQAYTYSMYKLGY